MSSADRHNARATGNEVARCAGILVALLLIAGCGISQEDSSRALERVPDWSLRPEGPPTEEDVGEIVEAGSGVMFGVGWRLAVFESDADTCTQFETQEVTATGCGDPRPPDDGAFAMVGSGSALSNGAMPVTGLASAQTFTVWVVVEGGERFPAELLPLDEAGLEGSAFVAIVPPDETATHLLAVARSGEILETYELEGEGR